MYKQIIDKYYVGCDALRHILLTHSQSVAQRALQIASLHPELHIDCDFVEQAAIGETATGDGVTAELAERRRLQVLPHLFVEISPVSGHKKTPCKNLSDFCMELADSSERCKRFPILSGFVLFFPVWAGHRWDALRRRSPYSRVATAMTPERLSPSSSATASI